MSFDDMFIRGEITQQQIAFIENLRDVPEGITLIVQGTHGHPWLYQDPRWGGRRLSLADPRWEHSDEWKKGEIDIDTNEVVLPITDPRIQDPEGWGQGRYDFNPEYAYLEEEIEERKREGVRRSNLEEFKREAEDAERRIFAVAAWNHACMGGAIVTVPGAYNHCLLCGMERPQARTNPGE